MPRPNDLTMMRKHLGNRIDPEKFIIGNEKRPDCEHEIVAWPTASQ
jgi:hypothetical protein